MSVTATSPVHVAGNFDPPLSRWLWLVKWLLAIPHYIVLAFLWIAFCVVSVIAFFAILFTGRYPRGLFDFNVGVLRWSWRVAYYSYGALGTDEYPPFTLVDVPAYPAHLDVAYPQHLSRGLVLVKWWLLAIPHYLVIAVFVGGVIFTIWTVDVPFNGLIGLLVLVAAVVLLVTGTYPRGIFDLVLGLNRWVYRVIAYAALMTDQYPPFRLDQGEGEPEVLTFGSGSDDAQPGAPSPSGGGYMLADQPPGPPPPRRPWTAGRVTALVLGALLALTSLGVFAGGVAALVVDQAQRDSDGFVTTGSTDLHTDSHAIVVSDITIDAGPFDWLLLDDLIGDVRIRAEATNSTPVFVGLARESDSAAYFVDVGYDTVDRVSANDDHITYVRHDGSAPAVRPGGEEFWAASAAGSGRQTLSVEPTSGNWMAAVMNADASAGVDVTASAGAELPNLGGFAGVLLLIGGIGLLISAVPIYLAARN